MGSQIISDKQNEKIETHVCNSISDNSDTEFVYKDGSLATEELKMLESIPKSVVLRRFWTPNDIQNLPRDLKGILHK